MSPLSMRVFVWRNNNIIGTIGAGLQCNAFHSQSGNWWDFTDCTMSKNTTEKVNIFFWCVGHDI